jgi:hypothetical protein
MVWVDSQGLGRNRFAIFRRVITLATAPQTALLHLFADSRYRLVVNGSVVHYGPGRFVQQYPEYDSLDIAPWLRSGDNVIVVEVNAYGTSAFQVMPDSRGGMIAWGEVGDHSLQTPGQWEVLQTEAWDYYSPLFSFAQGPVEIVDTRLLDALWYTDGHSDGDWQSAMELAHQKHWGALRPRSVPLLEMNILAPECVKFSAPLLDDEMRISCRPYQPDYNDLKASTKEKIYFAYATCIYSPTQQDVSLGLFWGPHYINGVEIALSKDPLRGNRQNGVASLRSGWNVLYGEVEALTESWGQLVGIPRDSGCTARAHAALDCTQAMRCSAILPLSTLRAQVAAIPSTVEELDKLPVVWQWTELSAVSGLPARIFAWERPAAQSDVNSHRISGYRFDLQHKPDWTILYDLGAEFLGHVCIEFEAPAGTILDVACDEYLRADGMVGLYSHIFVNSVDRIVARGGKQRAELFHVRGGRYVQLIVRRAPQGGEGEFYLHELAVRSAQVPHEVSGSFVCSDPVMNWTWQVGIETMRACTEEVYLDCPWRERGNYLRDSFIEMKTNRTYSADMRVARRSLELFAQSQMDDGQMRGAAPAWLGSYHDFTVIWIQFLHEYWRLSGELGLVEQLWSSVERIWASPLWQSHSSGLWNAPEGMNLFIDWGVNKVLRTGNANAVLNALRYQSLRCAAQMAQALGREQQARDYQQQADAVAQAFRTTLWDSVKQRIVAGLDENDGQIPDDALHATILALDYGLLDASQRTAVIDYVRERAATNLSFGLAGSLHSGYAELAFMPHLFAALYNSECDGEVEELIRQHYGFLKQQGALTLWEQFNMAHKKHGSHCHGWSSGPLSVFMYEIIGIRFDGRSSVDSLTIAPRATTLSWARGRFAHPHGLVDVFWRKEGEVLLVDVVKPSQLEISIQPRGALGALKLKATIQNR